MKNKGLMIFGTLGAILLGFIPPLVAWLLKDKLAEDEKGIIATLLNFELSLLIVCIIVSFIPVLGQLLCIAANVLNIVYAVMAFLAAKDNKPLKPLTIYEFVK